MSLWVRWCCVAALIGSASVSAAAQNHGTWLGRPATPDIVSHVEFDGNRRISSESLKEFIFTRPGDPYLGKDAVGRDVTALRNTQNFESVRFEVENDPRDANEKIVIFHLIERPVINQIEYHGLKSVTQSEVLNSFDERKVRLSVGGPFDPAKIGKAEVVIQTLLALHGHQAAVVKPTYETIPATNSVRLLFTVDEGPSRSK